MPAGFGHHSDWVSKEAFERGMLAGFRAPPGEAPKDDAHYAASPPALRCPRCQAPFLGLADGVKLAYSDYIRHGGRKHTIAADEIPEILRSDYRAAGCGCKLGYDWAAAYGVELKRRREGREPEPVALSVSVKTKPLLKRLADCIEQYSSLAGLELSLKQVEIMILLDQLEDLEPGKYRHRICLDLTPEVEDWRVRSNLPSLKPPVAVPDDFGYPSGFKKPSVLGTALLPRAVAETPPAPVRAPLPMADAGILRLRGPLSTPGPPSPRRRKLALPAAPAEAEGARQDVGSSDTTGG